jgi:hypothetical protein
MARAIRCLFVVVVREPGRLYASCNAASRYWSAVSGERIARENGLFASAMMARLPNGTVASPPFPVDPLPFFEDSDED